jgi:hypothetical protein
VEQNRIPAGLLTMQSVHETYEVSECERTIAVTMATNTP